MNDARRNASDDLVQTAAGLLVPATAIPANGNGAVQGAYDADGRRRIVLTKDDQRKIDRAIRIIQAAGLGVIVACRQGTRPDGKDACGQPLVNEGADTPDPGYGCSCSRVHFRP
jgi:hypothetical protein